MVVIPLRTCVACREQRPQQGLIRVSRVSEGVLEVFVPGAGQAAKGRSAYICPTRECVDRALKERRRRMPVGHALRTKIDPVVAEKIHAILGAHRVTLSLSKGSSTGSL